MSQPTYVSTPELDAEAERRSAAERQAQRRKRRPDLRWAARRGREIWHAVEAVGFKAWERIRVQQERDSAAHREIDSWVSKNRHRGNWTTFYPGQIKQLEALVRFARYEAIGERSLIIVSCDTCDVRLGLRSARRALAWYARHGRHVTWNRRVVVRPAPQYQRRTADSDDSPDI